MPTAQSCGRPRPPCTGPCALIGMSVCHESTQKYLEGLDLKAVGITENENTAMAKEWNIKSPELPEI